MYSHSAVRTRALETKRIADSTKKCTYLQEPGTACFSKPWTACFFKNPGRSAQRVLRQRYAALKNIRRGHWRSLLFAITRACSVGSDLFGRYADAQRGSAGASCLGCFGVIHHRLAGLKYRYDPPDFIRIEPVSGQQIRERGAEIRVSMGQKVTTQWRVWRFPSVFRARFESRLG